MHLLHLPVVLVTVLVASLAAQPSIAPDFTADPVVTPQLTADPADAFIPTTWTGPGPWHKLLLSPDEGPVLEILRRSGAVIQEVSYPSFSLVVVDARPLGGTAGLARLGLTPRDEQSLLALNGYPMDGTRPQSTLSALRPDEVFGDPSTGGLEPRAGLYLVQFVGPVKDEWIQSLRSIGGTFTQYVPMNAYVVRLEPENVPLLENLHHHFPFVQLAVEWHPAFRMSPAIRWAARHLPGDSIPITVQVLDGANVRPTLRFLAGITTGHYWYYRVGPYINVQVDVDPARFRDIARRPDVFAIEGRGIRKRLDEAQGQICAGNVSGSAPTGPGYLAWLATKGFGSSQFGTFSVNVVDDATSLTGHPDLPSSRVAFQNNPTSQGGAQGGHGFLNAHIVAGFNSQSGSAYEDASGFNYGLGIAPWARVGSTAIFGNGNSTGSTWEATAYAQGARISTNSWGFQSGGGPVADYDSNAQEYDYLVRDARSSASGNQELAITFAAGNDGSSSNTVSTPSTAKNVITVGASENWRQTGTDGCGIGNSGANDIRQVISFSSRGPVNASGGDGRYKPEIVAPGTHIQAGVPQSNFNGSSVCNGNWPSGQTLYGWSSGTSHSTPGIAGCMALLRQWFANNGLSTPSPAMQKAYLLNSAAYMTGVGGALPSNTQGMGRADLGRAFDGTARVLVDQTQVLASTGQTWSWSGNVATAAQPLRVTLAWTDAPGPTTGAPWVNNLDLEVTIGGTLYRGNVFSTSNSSSGGSADIRNNNESVFLPAGQSGSISVTVRGTNIAGDGVPGNGDSTDQDFAIVICNGTTGGGGPSVPVAQFSGSPTSGTEPLTVSFSDLSSGSPTSWSWNFGDGGTSTTQNPSHTYTAAGAYSVTLTATNSAGSDSESKTNYITVNPAGTPSIDDGSFELQTPGGAPASPWTVTFGTGHVIRSGSDAGMPTEGSRWCEIAADSTNAATPPSNPGGAGALPNGAAGIAQTFSYSGSNTTLIFDAAFARNENANQATYNDFMSVDVTDGVTAHNLYYADTFSATSGSSSHGFAITPVTEVSVDLLSRFPSSTSSTSFTVLVQVANAGDSIQPSVGYVDHFRFGSLAPAAPMAGFSGTPTSGDAPLNVSFTDLSSGSITSRSWSFGDGGTSSSQNPSHTYSSSGSYTVTLTVTGPGGSDSETRSGYITVTTPPAAPSAEFSGTPTSGDTPLNVSFTDLSSGSITSRSWSFGDGSTSSSQNPTHTYSAAGTYTVTLTVSGPGGSNSETKSDYITATQPPSGGDLYYVSFVSTTTVPGIGSVADDDIVYYDAGSGSWSMFIDGSDIGLSGTDIAAFSITASGDVLFSIDGATYDMPGLTGGPSGTTVTENDIVRFSPTSTGTSTAGTFSFYFDGSDVGLTSSSEDIDGLRLEASGSLLISTTSSPSVPGLSSVRDEDVIRFTPTALGSTTSGSWTFIFDGSDLGLNSGGEDLRAVSVDAAGNLLFSTVGGFNAGGGGGQDEDIARFTGTYGSVTSGTIDLALDLSALGFSTGADIDGVCFVSGSGGGPTPPTADFTADVVAGTAPLGVNFSDLSFGSIMSWTWDFGDGSTSTAQNPSHTYNTAGTYTVTLTVTGPGGSDTEVKTDYVTADPAGGSGADVLFVSFLTTTAVPGVGNATDDDIVAHDFGTNTWSKIFDGSDVGLSGTDINAFAILPGGDILMSFNTPVYDVPGLTGGPDGTTVTENDIIMFSPTSLGASTAGSFTFYADGSDLGLDTSAEDIDGLAISSTGSILFSTIGNPGIASGWRDEDVFEFVPTSLGSSTAGTVALLFDGSDVELTAGGEDLNALHMNGNDLLFSTANQMNAQGVVAEDEDINQFSGTYGTTTTGVITLHYDLSTLGILSEEDVDGMHLMPGTGGTSMVVGG